ncbi:uncharacterized protein LOC122648773 [Telopea speciosissima]|uniref:uncharacterized protein LOC122648773 n=1 Tax=Telopea speciosissima TaxID=54955 RepID=UPI001CC6DB58|nr:uncharacterized protein LOC122648773 [Telopea speciosissima]
MSLSIATPPGELSSFRVLSVSHQQCLLSRISRLSIHNIPPPATTMVIRMGGGPRTFPGGVSKWQWKRMQAKKAKQLLKARLCRERQIYEMRKRAELRAAVSELERPWEVVERAPTLFSVRADEQLKVLADRFQRPGGYDLWSEKDGPQLFQTVDDLPSARFFPKGVVHSLKPYGSIADSSVEEAMGSNFQGSVSESVTGGSVSRVGKRSRKSKKAPNPGGRARSDWKREAGTGDSPTRREEWKTNTEASGTVGERQRSGKFHGDRTGKDSRVIFKNKEHKRSFGSRNSYRAKSEDGTLGAVGREKIRINNGSYSSANGHSNARRTSSRSRATEEVYNMSLQQDGSYELQQGRSNTKSRGAV